MLVITVLSAGETSAVSVAPSLVSFDDDDEEEEEESAAALQATAHNPKPQLRLVLMEPDPEPEPPSVRVTSTPRVNPRHILLLLVIYRAILTDCL